MEYKKIKLGSYNLHLIKTDRFRKINIRVTFQDIIKKEDITKMNCLLDLLVYSTKNYPTSRDLGLKLQDLYGASLNTFSSRFGKYFIHHFDLSFLNEKYTESGMVEESVKLLKEVIFNPNVKNKMFDETSFKIIKDYNEVIIKSIKENPAKYGIIRMLETMNVNAPYSYRLFGYLEDLEKIDEKNLYEAYNALLNNSNIDIYVIGDIDFVYFEKLIRDNFNFRTLKKSKEDIFITHDKFRRRVLVVKEIEELKQSKLSIGLKISKLTPFEYKYVSTIYNSILGNSGDSKLFKIVREENSLCYSIRSSINRTDSLLIINAGITKDNFKKTVALIKKVIKDLSHGRFTEEDIDKVKNEYISFLDNIYDSPKSILGMYHVTNLIGLDDIETRREKIKEVSKEDIIKFSKKVHLDTIFLLEGVDEDAKEDTDS